MDKKNGENEYKAFIVIVLRWIKNMNKKSAFIVVQKSRKNTGRLEVYSGINAGVVASNFAKRDG